MTGSIGSIRFIGFIGAIGSLPSVRCNGNPLPAGCLPFGELSLLGCALKSRVSVWLLIPGNRINKASAAWTGTDRRAQWCIAQLNRGKIVHLDLNGTGAPVVMVNP